MVREPIYDPEVDKTLQSLENAVAPSELRLLTAVCDALDLICDHGDSAEARRERLRTRTGDSVWRVRVRGTDWVVLWWPFADEARIYYLGPG